MHYLGSLWSLFKRFGQFLGDLLARVVLTVFYFTIFAPFGAGVRFLGDPLQLRRTPPTSFWINRTTRDRVLEDANRQF